MSMLFAKLGNGAEVEAQLVDLGRLDYALDAPLSDRVWIDKV
jgi:hypothetical protein